MFKKNFPVLLIFLVVLSLAILNFIPGIWLSGWDNLHPEFNFPLNIKRSIFATWQEYQGLGLMGGMGHASDLPRQLFLWLISLILPAHFLRYFYHFLMLFLGPLGVYFLLKEFILRGFDQKEKASLTGAIFYLFNLATLQMFYVPFEPSSTHFAFLPWLFLANLSFLNKGDKKSFLFFVLVNALSVPQGYVGTFFLVYLISLTLVFIVYLWQRKESFKKILVIYLIIFCLNAFWLLPNLYFVTSNIGVNVSAKINQMATETNFLKNKKYGNPTNIMILKGFWFENVEVNKAGEMSYQMGDWVNHLKKPFILGIGYLLFLLSALGVMIACKKRLKEILIFLPILIFAFTFISIDTPILSFIANLFYKIPLFYQIFRFPFTKFAILTAFCLSIFYSLAYLSISALGKKPLLKSAIFLFFAFLPIIFLYPIFQGKLFYFKNQAKIPSEYFQIVEFFKNQEKNERVANFPQHTFWGWNFYRWGYSGSGFLWYGIEQPILDRAFDPWSNKNENYFWEVSYALYSQNKELFEKVLEKYQIGWLLVDRNVINPSSPKALYLDELEDLISASEKINLSQEFGKIKIYQVQLEAPMKNFVFLAENLLTVGPKYDWNNYDVAYLENGNYLSSFTTHNSQLTTQLYYPFRSLFSGRSQEDLEFEVEEREEYFIFKKTLPEALAGYHLEVLEPEKKELVWVDPNNLSRVRYLKPEINLNGELIEVKVPKFGGYYSAETEPATEPSVQAPKNCNQFTQGKVSNEVIKANEKQFLRLTSIDANNCSASFWLPNLPHRYTYVVTVESRHIKGKSLLFWLENLNSRKVDIETYLLKEKDLVTSYFIQPPMEEDGLGYTLHFDNISIGRSETINDLGKITVNLIPYNFLKEIKLTKKENSNELQVLSAPLSVLHPNPSYYRIERSPAGNQILVLSQAFHPGWQAYEANEKIPTLLLPIFGKRINSHVLINNWENGWLLDNQDKIAIIFLPQYLEYFGFLLVFLFGCFTLIFLVK